MFALDELDSFRWCCSSLDMPDSQRNPHQLSNSPSSTHSSMEPLDLSRNSTTVPFVHPPTPDEKPNPANIFRVSRQNSLMERQMSVDYTYEPPRIVIQPKTEWHYRNMRDLASKHIPLLSGNGPQRTPIRVTVSLVIISINFVLSSTAVPHCRCHRNPTVQCIFASKSWRPNTILIHRKWLFQWKHKWKWPIVGTTIISTVWTLPTAAKPTFSTQWRATSTLSLRQRNIPSGKKSKSLPFVFPHRCHCDVTSILVFECTCLISTKARRLRRSLSNRSSFTCVD